MAWSYTALTDRSVAKFAEIISDNGFVFINGNASSSKTLNIVASGFTPTSYKWYKKNSNGTYDEIQGATSATYVVQGVTNIGTYKGSAFDGNEELSDYVTIDAVSDGTSGSSPYLFSLSNENFTINTTNDLKPTTSLNYEVKVTGYHGSSVMTSIASGTPTAEQFKITIPSGSIFSLKTGTTDTLVYAANTSTALSNENLAETITIAYDTNKSETKTITVSCAKNGISPTVTQGTGSVTITDASGNTGTVSDGANGVSVSSVTEYYQRTNSATAPAKPTSSSSLGSWKTTVDNPISSAQYLYNCEIIKFSNNTETVTNPVQIAKYVTNGTNGKGIASIQNVYKLTTNTTAPSAPSATDAVWTGSATGSTSAWGTVCPTTTTTNKYLWNVERVTYDSSPATYSVSSVKLISTHGDTGANAIVMTSASTPSGTYNGQVGIWQGQIYIWNGTQWENQTNILPTDAVLHYSFDDMPDYPDGTAVYKKDNDFTDTTGWSSTGNTPTVTSGKITLSGNNDTYARYSLQISANSMICVRGIANKTSHLYFTVRHSGASSDTTLKEIDIIQGKLFEIYVIVDAQSTYFNFYVYNSEWSITLSQIYIGDGSYSTPIIDNANGEWNSVSQSGIAVQGVSGKGLYCPSNQVVDINGFNVTNDFTFSIWVNPQSNANNKGGRIFSTSGFFCYNGYPTGNNYLYFALSSDTGNTEYVVTGRLLPINQFNHLVFTKNGTTVKVYLNGSLLKQQIISFSNLKQSTTGQIGNIYNSRPQSYDDLLIFNRALTEKEVLALYYNKANTPQFYTKADYDLTVRKYQYLGRTLYVPTSNSVTVYTSATVINGTSASKTAQNGDFVSVMYSGSSGTTPLGKVYKFNGQSWELDSDTGHEIEAMADILMLADNLPSNGTTDLFLSRLTANTAFINYLQTKQLTLSSNGKIQSSDYVSTSGAEGFKIDASGKAEFNGGCITIDDMRIVYDDTKYNMSFGKGAGESLTTGQHNLLIGTGAGASTTTGKYNTIIGDYAAYEATNTSEVGHNVVVGQSAFLKNTSGNMNVAIGGNTLMANTTGSQNIAIGVQAMKENIADYDNIAIGVQALYAAKTPGVYNIAIGYRALGYSSEHATLLQMNIGIGNRTAPHLTDDATGNIFIGENAGAFLESGDNNLCIGRYTSLYLKNGHKQVNINDRLVYIEFKSTTIQETVFNALNSICGFGSATYASCGAMGRAGTDTSSETHGISVVRKDSSTRIKCLNYNGTTYLTVNKGNYSAIGVDLQVWVVPMKDPKNYDFGITAGTYTPSAFYTMVTKFVAEGSSRSIASTPTITVNGQSITPDIIGLRKIQSGNTNNYVVYFKATKANVDLLAIVSSFSTNASYVTYVNNVPSNTTDKYANYNITLSSDLRFA